MKKLIILAMALVAMVSCTKKQNAQQSPEEAQQEFDAFVAAIQALPDDADSLCLDLSQKFYASHPADSFGIMVFNQIIRYYLSYDELKEALDKACDQIKNDPHNQKMLASKLVQQQTAPGSQYIDIEGVTVAIDVESPADGLDIKLSDIVKQGKPVLVDFWASWCGPCRQEIPNIANVANKYAGKINVVGIAVWDKLADTRKAMTELPISWPIIFSEQATEPYGIDGIPHIMLIAPDGTILARDLRGEAIEKAVAEL
ncbi:MAG: TlpA family protein disulfide reductase [Bacteroidales bacterium]|nr:TlpA family protein disulfide reductase [Candidatus Liminaster caballi]